MEDGRMSPANNDSRLYSKQKNHFVMPARRKTFVSCWGNTLLSCMVSSLTRSRPEHDTIPFYECHWIHVPGVEVQQAVDMIQSQQYCRKKKMDT
jgi:hypothetical protein